MVSPQKIRYYSWYVFGILGAAIFWGGLWGSINGAISNPPLTFLIGMVILAFAAIVKMKMDPLAGVEKGVHDVLHMVHKHPEKHKFHVKYYDKAKGNHILINGKDIHEIENSFLVLKNKNGKSTGAQESFVPFHRIKEVLHEGKSYWKG
ncbi:DUF504 domain-containing protein [Candidatus Woesearchaeota archaeon]|nr:DUF504 domain-containing protein [Candidatus Woesearchaeota archaeon]